MELRAMTTKHEPYYFSIKDCPARINDTMSVLVNKPGSPILLIKSYARGIRELGMFETDFVLSKETGKFLGFVVYRDGFYIYNPNNDSLLPLEHVENYTFMENTQLTYIDKIMEKKGTIKYRFNNIVFSLNQLYKSSEDGSLVYTRTNELISILDSVLLTGLFKNNKPICFGDIMGDGIIVLNNNKPRVMLHEGDYRDLREDEYDEYKMDCARNNTCGTNV